MALQKRPPNRAAAALALRQSCVGNGPWATADALFDAYNDVATSEEFNAAYNFVTESWNAYFGATTEDTSSTEDTCPLPDSNFTNYSTYNPFESTLNNAMPPIPGEIPDETNLNIAIAVAAVLIAFGSVAAYGVKKYMQKSLPASASKDNAQEPEKRGSDKTTGDKSQEPENQDSDQASKDKPRVPKVTGSGKTTGNESQEPENQDSDQASKTMCTIPRKKTLKVLGVDLGNFPPEQKYEFLKLLLKTITSVSRTLPLTVQGTPFFKKSDVEKVNTRLKNAIRNSEEEAVQAIAEKLLVPENIQQEYSQALEDLKNLNEKFGELESKVDAKGEIPESFAQKFRDLQSQIEPMRMELAALQDAQNVATDLNQEYESVQTLTLEARSLLEELQDMQTILPSVAEVNDIYDLIIRSIDKVDDISTSFEDRLKKLDSSLEEKYDKELTDLKETIKKLSTATKTATTQTSEHFDKIDSEIAALKSSLEGIRPPPGNAGAPAARTDLLARIEELEAFLRDSMVAHANSFNSSTLTPSFTHYRSFKERPQSALRAALGLVISGHSGHSGHSARALWRGRVPCI